MAPTKARTRPVANTSALPEGVPIVGAQLAGLAALALAFFLAVTRLSIRRRPTAKPEPDPEPADKPDAETANKPDEDEPDPPAAKPASKDDQDGESPP